MKLPQARGEGELDQAQSFQVQPRAFEAVTCFSQTPGTVDDIDKIVSCTISDTLQIPRCFTSSQRACSIVLWA